MSDEEIILRRILRRLLSSGGDKTRSRPGPSSRHGLYVYEQGAWRYAETLPGGDGARYALYFDNALCPACRLFDDTWFSFAEKLGGSLVPVVVLCGWFSRNCSSPKSSRLFHEFNVSVSPTVVFARLEGGRLIEELRLEGVVTLELLKDAARRLSPSAP